MFERLRAAGHLPTHDPEGFVAALHLLERVGAALGGPRSAQYGAWMAVMDGVRLRQCVRLPSRGRR